MPGVSSPRGLAVERSFDCRGQRVQWGYFNRSVASDALVFFMIHLWEDWSRRMTTPLSDDAMGSLDKISPRHVFETTIRILLQRDSTRHSLPGWARNLSESGLGAFVAEALIPGESVTLEIPLPDCGKQAIPAKVVRALGTEYGFQFTALSSEQRGQIRAALRECPAIPHHSAGQ